MALTAKQLIRLLKSVPPQAHVVFGGEMLTVRESKNPAFTKPLKQVGVGAEVLPVLFVSHATVDGVDVVVLSNDDPEEDKAQVQAESYWVVGK